jgi:hypothetical protein
MDHWMEWQLADGGSVRFNDMQFQSLDLNKLQIILYKMMLDHVY